VATWLVAAAKLGLIIAFVPSGGLMAVGLATVSTFFALMVIMLVMARVATAAETGKESVRVGASAAAPGPLGSSLGWGVVGMLLAACAAGLPLHLLAGPGVLRLAGGLALFVVVYAAALFALRVVRVEEIRTLWRIIVAERPKAGAAAPPPM